MMLTWSRQRIQSTRSTPDPSLCRTAWTALAQPDRPSPSRPRSRESPIDTISDLEMSTMACDRADSHRTRFSCSSPFLRALMSFLMTPRSPSRIRATLTMSWQPCGLVILPRSLGKMPSGLISGHACPAWIPCSFPFFHTPKPSLPGSKSRSMGPRSSVQCSRSKLPSADCRRHIIQPGCCLCLGCRSLAC